MNFIVTFMVTYMSPMVPCDTHCFVSSCTNYLSVISATYLHINSGRWYLSHVPSTFATVNTHAGGISKEWRQLVLANCDFEGETGPIVPMFTGLSGNTWETAKIAHESHNDVRRPCWRHLHSAGRTWAAKGPVI